MAKHYDEILEAFRAHPDTFIQEIDRRRLRQFLAGTLEAIAFTDGTDTDDELTGLDLTIEGEGGWGDGELMDMLHEGHEFMLKARDTIARRVGLGDLWADGVGYTTERLAHDLWLTRNGHGAGFWDRKFTYGEDGDPIPELGDELTALAEALGTVDVYKGDDGRAYT
jgi:hypothetical protein